MTREEIERHILGRKTETTVNGIRFLHWADMTYACVWAENMETHEIRKIHANGYVSRDLTVRKEIATSFRLPTFRK